LLSYRGLEREEKSHLGFGALRRRSRVGVTDRYPSGRQTIFRDRVSYLQII
jgi:hypothetical protein